MIVLFFIGNSSSGEAMSTSPTSSHMDYMPATSSAPMASGGSVSGTLAPSASSGPVRQVAVPPMSSSTSNSQNTGNAGTSASSGGIVLQHPQPLQMQQQSLQQQEMAGTSAESTQVRPVLLNGPLISSVTHTHSFHLSIW